MTERFPGYDVLRKRHTLSWNEPTRRAVDRRLAVHPGPRFFNQAEWETLRAVCARIVPQPADRPPVPLPAFVDAKMAENSIDGYRFAPLLPQGDAWKAALAALDEAAHAHGAAFHALAAAQQDALLRQMQRGALDGPLWRGMPSALVFSKRVLHDIVGAYYAHPTAWSEIGWAGRPARAASCVSTRTGATRGRPPRPILVESTKRAVRTTVSSEPPGDPMAAPRATRGRAPDVFAPGGWVPMREYRDDEAVDFAIVGTGAGGGTLACRLAEKGFSVVAFDAGPFFRPLDDFASDETEQEKLYWKDARIVEGNDWMTMGGNNSGKAVGGSTVHFAMVSLRFRPEWFKARTRLGYGADWPLDWREMWGYYRQAEEALSISGPVTYPWGPKRPRYPYRAHPINAAGVILAKGAEAMGMAWTPTPLATVSAPRGKSPPCVYRGFCRFGCSTNAKQSALVVWVPRAVAAGAEIRDLAMVARIETNPAGRATGLHYTREGAWRFQRAKNVVVAGYAVETPRLLLMSADDRFPDGLANSTGLVGKNLMTQPNQAVFGDVAEEIRWSKAPPSTTLTEHWNYDDRKDFHGGYCWMGQGPLPIEWAGIQTGARGLWGDALLRAMSNYNHAVGVKMVGEAMPDERNRVTLAEETDQYGLPIPRIHYAWTDNDKTLIAHGLDQMEQSLHAAGVRNIFRQTQDANHLGGTARMGDDPRTSVVDADCRSWDIRNLWVCDGSVFPTVGGVNPSLTIQAVALRTADRIEALARRGEL